METVHHLNLLSGVSKISSITKEFSAKTKEQLQKKLNFSLQGTLEYLSTLDVLPIDFKISETNSCFYLENGEVASKINLELIYDFINMPVEKQVNIIKKINAENHKHLSLDKKLSHGTLHGTKILKREESSHIFVSAKTLEELISIFKDKVWQEVKKSKFDEQYNLKIKIAGIQFYQTKEGFFGECTCNSVREIKKYKIDDKEEH